MPIGLRPAPKALPDPCQCTVAYFVPWYQMTPEDGMSIPRQLAILWRVAVQFPIEHVERLNGATKAKGPEAEERADTGILHTVAPLLCLEHNPLFFSSMANH